MNTRIVCPHCKSNGRLIRLVSVENDRLKCSHCNRSYSRDEIALIYENAARSFSEAAAKIRRVPAVIAGNEFAMSKGVRYPKPNESTPTNGALVLGLVLVGIAMTFLVSCAKSQGWM